MYSRVTLLEIDTMRVDVSEAVELFRAAVQPGLAALPGYEGSTVLATPEGKGMILSYWATEADAQAAARFATGELERYVTLFKSPPGREQYEVAFADFPRVDALVA
jgi:hypothetical protein